MLLVLCEFGVLLLLLLLPLTMIPSVVFHRPGLAAAAAAVATAAATIAPAAAQGLHTITQGTLSVCEKVMMYAADCSVRSSGYHSHSSNSSKIHLDEFSKQVHVTVAAAVHSVVQGNSRSHCVCLHMLRVPGSQSWLYTLYVDFNRC